MAPPASKDVDPAAKPLPPEAFESVDEKMTLGQIIDKLGPAQGERGSGLCILLWPATDGRSFAVGTTDCDRTRRPIYAKFL